MSKVYLAELKVKIQMIKEILKSSKGIYHKSQLESKTFSELKYIYYECRKPISQSYNDMARRN